jgi:hypothetical protein
MIASPNLNMSMMSSKIKKAKITKKNNLETEPNTQRPDTQILK